HERGAGMDPDQQRGGLREPLPALDLHPEPVVHERVPEVLLALDEIPVGTVQRPLGSAVRHPARDAGLLAPPLFDLALSFLRVALSRPLSSVGRSLPGVARWGWPRVAHVFLPGRSWVALPTAPDYKPLGQGKCRP